MPEGEDIRPFPTLDGPYPLGAIEKMREVEPEDEEEDEEKLQLAGNIHVLAPRQDKLNSKQKNARKRAVKSYENIMHWKPMDQDEVERNIKKARKRFKISSIC